LATFLSEEKKKPRAELKKENLHEFYHYLFN